MKKESVSSAVKNMMCALRAMVRSRTRALKARLIVYSLLAQTNFLVSSSTPLRTVTHHQHHQHQHQQLLNQDRVEGETGTGTETETAVIMCTEYKVDTDTDADADAETDSTGVYAEYEATNADAETDVGKGDNNGGPSSSSSSSTSVIEMVKNFKEEAGEEFSLEKDIDHVADLFIRNFHQQMRMQKQNSLNRYQEMLFDGTL